MIVVSKRVGNRLTSAGSAARIDWPGEGVAQSILRATRNISAHPAAYI
jgi:hypothetical protein